jgi:hypothetical protein
VRLSAALVGAVVGAIAHEGFPARLSSWTQAGLARWDLGPDASFGDRAVAQIMREWRPVASPTLSRLLLAGAG